MIKTIKGWGDGNYQDVEINANADYGLWQNGDLICLDARMARELHAALGELIAAADLRKAEDDLPEARHEATALRPML